MLRPQFSQVILRSAGLLLAGGLQIWSRDWHVLLVQRLRISEYGPTTFWYATLDILLGVGGGFLIAAAVLPRGTQAGAPRISNSVLSLSILLPAVGLALKWGAAVSGFYLPVRYLVITDWALESAFPALWLGFSIGVLINQLRK